MLKRLRVSICLVAILLLAGCSKLATLPTIQIPGQVNSEATSTPFPLIAYITATPFSPVTTDSGQNSTPVQAYISPTQLPSNASITITTVDDLGDGRAVVNWTPVGNFPAGYQVVWSSTSQAPTYPNDQSTYAGDPASRSAMISVNPGQLYYVRACRYVNNSCDVYSNLGIFSLTKPTAIPWRNNNNYPNGDPYSPYYPRPSVAYNSSGNVITSTSFLSINSIADAGTGKARMDWSTVGTFSNGFRIVYSSSSSTPYYGDYPYYVITDGNTRSAYLDGTPGTTYYYRICRYTGSTCDIYSNTYTFTYPGTTPTATTVPAGINITDIHDTASNHASISWDASGSTFSGGFKILLSTIHSYPTLSDTVVTVTDGSLRTAAITGNAGQTYKIRICKVNGSTCSPSSLVSTFTFGSVSLGAIVDTANKQATINWNETGIFPAGFKILYSDVNETPTESDSVIPVSGSSTRSSTISGTPGKRYYYRVCAVYGTSCVIFSDVKNFTFAEINVTGVYDDTGGYGHITWDAVGDLSQGFRLVYSLTNTDPKVDDSYSMLISGGSTATSMTFSAITGLTYHMRICQVKSTGCGVYSNVVDITIASDISLTADATVANQVTLTWNLPATLPDHGYSVFRVDGLTADPIITGHQIGTVSSPSTHTFVDTSVGAVGSTYSYKICTLNSGDNCTSFSSIAKTTIILGTVTATTEVPTATTETPGSTTIAPTATTETPTATTETPTATTETPTATTETPTSTPDPATLNITGVEDTATSGEAAITWDGTDVGGNFDAGFEIYLSTTSDTPGPGNYDKVFPVADGTKRTTTISGTPGTPYHIRICKVFGTGCSVFSGKYDFTFGSLAISEAHDTANGQAEISWAQQGTFDAGIKILLSRTTTAPTLTNNDAVVDIPTGSPAAGTIHGVEGTKYYIRLCKFDGSACLFYSDYYEFTFASVSISTIDETGTGQGSVNFAAAGAVDNGFKLLLSKSSTAPTLTTNDEVFTEPNGSAKKSPISGNAGSLYHVRMCIYGSSDCTVYSNTVDITFGSISIIGVTDTGDGQAQINWSHTGNFPDGFSVLLSKSTTTPTLSDNDGVFPAPGDTTTSATIKGIAGTAYHIRICALNTSVCTVYSTDYPFTFGQITLGTLTNDTTGHVTLDWSYVGTDTPAGYTVLFSITNSLPTLGDRDVEVDAGTATSAGATLNVGSIYNYRVCTMSGLNCVLYSLPGTTPVIN